MPSPWRTINGRPEKRCPTCAARGRDPWHPWSAFARDATRKNGLSIRCKECMAEDHGAWRLLHPDSYAAHVERSMARARANPEQARAYGRRYDERRKEARKEARRERLTAPMRVGANRKPITVDGVAYESIGAAARALGLTPGALTHRYRRTGTYDTPPPKTLSDPREGFDVEF